MILSASLTKVVDAIGTSGFEKHLADMLGEYVAHDFVTMTRYSTENVPCFLIHSHTFSSRQAELYLKNYVAADPYADYWRNTRQPGVVWLQDVAAQRRKYSQYRDVFLPEIGVSDEIGVFAPAVGTDSVAIFFNKREGHFSKNDVEQLQEVFPAMVALYRQHIRFLISFGGISDSPSMGRPMRATRDTGATIWVTNEWQEQQSPDVQLISTSIAQDFGTDNLFIWTLAPKVKSPGAKHVTSFDIWAEQIELTNREKDIVQLVLQGQGSQRIAQELNLSVGNIKNHKRRMYSKLDITSERELFIMYIEAMSIRG